MTRKHFAGKRTLLRTLIMLALCTAMALMVISAQAKGKLVTDIVADTYVAPMGQSARAFTLTVADPAVLNGLTPADFTVENNFLDIFSSVKAPEDVTAISIVDNRLTLTVSPFLYANNFAITCKAVEGLSFTKADVRWAYTAVADTFASRTADGSNMVSVQYKLYSPPKAEQPLPLVLLLHGGGESGEDNRIQLRANRLAIEYAEPAAQQAYPSYIMAPQSTKGWSKGERDTLVQEIRRMIASGKVDASRVYVMGPSMGGIGTFNIITDHPDFFAAAVPICGFARDLEGLTKVANLPIWIHHAEGDPVVLVSGSRDAYAKLKDAGSTAVKYTEYTNEQMHELDLVPFMDITAAYHFSWVNVLLNPAVQEWMFAQQKAGVQVVSRSLNLRVQGDTGADIIKVLESGDSLTPIGVKGLWTQVQLADGAVGWVASRYIQ